MPEETTAYDILNKALTKAYREGIKFRHKNTGNEYCYMAIDEYTRAPFIFLNITRKRRESFDGKELGKLVCITPLEEALVTEEECPGST